MLDSDILAAIRARRATISTPPWTAEIDGENGNVLVTMGDDTEHELSIANMEGSCERCHANQEFIAHAPEDIDWLLSALADAPRDDQAGE
jgi:hypothetical protein